MKKLLMALLLLPVCGIAQPVDVQVMYGLPIKFFNSLTQTRYAGRIFYNINTDVQLGVGIETITTQYSGSPEGKYSAFPLYLDLNRKFMAGKHFDLTSGIIAGMVFGKDSGPGSNRVYIFGGEIGLVYNFCSFAGIRADAGARWYTSSFYNGGIVFPVSAGVVLYL
ncbi:MAG: hypothetical protein H0X33_08050 [Taibaiella sp.]|nr:hypothetical protein [Taibaiella sp.]